MFVSTRSSLPLMTSWTLDDLLLSWLLLFFENLVYASLRFFRARKCHQELKVRPFSASKKKNQSSFKVEHVIWLSHEKKYFDLQKSSSSFCGSRTASTAVTTNTSRTSATSTTSTTTTPSSWPTLHKEGLLPLIPLVQRWIQDLEVHPAKDPITDQNDPSEAGYQVRICFKSQGSFLNTFDSNLRRICNKYAQDNQYNIKLTLV